MSFVSSKASFVQNRLALLGEHEGEAILGIEHPDFTGRQRSKSFDGDAFAQSHAPIQLRQTTLGEQHCA
jgi:hypothetical protein